MLLFLLNYSQAQSSVIQTSICSVAGQLRTHSAALGSRESQELRLTVPILVLRGESCFPQPQSINSSTPKYTFLNATQLLGEQLFGRAALVSLASERTTKTRAARSTLRAALGSQESQELRHTVPRQYIDRY